MNVKRTDLERVLQLLNESKKLHEGGHYEAHEKASEARLLLSKIIDSGAANGAKSTG